MGRICEITEKTAKITIRCNYAQNTLITSKFNFSKTKHFQQRFPLRSRSPEIVLRGALFLGGI
jgi:hypothetical protein